MADIQYPEEIFKETHYDENGCSLWSRGDYVKRAYRTGLEDGKKSAMSESLEGYSNLTEAISNGVDIDWPKLNGREAKCVHPEMGTLSHKLKRDPDVMVRSFAGWYKYDGSTSHIWVNALKESWDNTRGWSLWIEGEIPLKRKTAETLLPGTIFKGQENGIEPRTYVVVLSEDGGTQVIEKYSTRENINELGSIDVLEVISGGFVGE